MVQGKHCAQIGPNHTDAVGWTTRALDTLGTSSGDFVCKEIDRLGAALGMKADQGAINAALAVLDGQRPRDEIEAQLLIQMAATHAYAMDLLGRSKRSQLLDHLENRILAASRPARGRRPARGLRDLIPEGAKSRAGVLMDDASPVRRRCFRR
jgi:hypothetical protein